MTAAQLGLVSYSAQQWSAFGTMLTAGVALGAAIFAGLVSDH